MFRIRLSLENPLTGDSEGMVFQFDPASLTQAKWNTAYAAVAAKLATLVANSTPKEPATW